MMSFEDYKSKISIIQILEDLGYKQDIGKGKVSPVYQLTDSNGNKIDSIVVKNPHSPREYYFDRNYKGGDLIQFLKNHINDFTQFQHNNLYVRLNMILGHYANTPYIENGSYYTKISEQQKFNRERYIETPTNVSDLKYLTVERKINPATVETFLPFITRVKDTQGKGNFLNIAFPYTNPQNGEKTNYELRNYNFKGMAAGGDKSNSAWIADFTSHPLMAKNIYFAESALDAMSFYELNKNKINLSDSVFVSVGGYISDNQIKNALQKYPNAKVHTCFDRDLNGNLYDIKVQCIMNGTELKIKAKDNTVEFVTPNGIFELNKEDVSIERFREKSKDASTKLIVHKADGAKDFNEILMSRTPTQKKTFRL